MPNIWYEKITGIKPEKFLFFCIALLWFVYTVSMNTLWSYGYAQVKYDDCYHTQQYNDIVDTLNFMENERNSTYRAQKINMTIQCKELKYFEGLRP